MEFINATRMRAAYTLGMAPDGRERLVVVIKGTFDFPNCGEELELADEQLPLVVSDEFTGEPGSSSTIYESEFAPLKPRCDILLNGSAYAPGGRPAARVPVSLRVGDWTKSLEVTGDRVWERGLYAATPSEPKKFTRLPFSYDRAYGGSDVLPENLSERACYLQNPVGVGHYPSSRGSALVGLPLPNTSEPGRIVTGSRGSYRPMAFGAIGRNFASRLAFAGTYDQDWIDEVFPFLPTDFDVRYYQAAPDDQQIDYPHNDEVELNNLTPEGRTTFRLPRLRVPVEFTKANRDRTEMQAALDTVVIEPDHCRVLLLWRASIALRGDILELKQVVVGRMPRGWYRARRLGKTYYRTLRDLVAARARSEDSEV